MVLCVSTVKYQDQTVIIMTLVVMFWKHSWSHIVTLYIFYRVSCNEQLLVSIWYVLQIRDIQYFMSWVVCLLIYQVLSASKNITINIAVFSAATISGWIHVIIHSPLFYFSILVQSQDQTWMMKTRCYPIKLYMTPHGKLYRFFI